MSDLYFMKIAGVQGNATFRNEKGWMQWDGLAVQQDRPSARSSSDMVRVFAFSESDNNLVEIVPMLMTSRYGGKQLSRMEIVIVKLIGSYRGATTSSVTLHAVMKNVEVLPWSTRGMHCERTPDRSGPVFDKDRRYYPGHESCTASSNSTYAFEVGGKNVQWIRT